ncbi:MAG: hypothetical protein ABIO99_05280 [Candidatus Limnocylindria bacterium]
MRAKIDAEELADFRRCRRAWDLGSPNRRNLEPVRDAVAPDLAEAVRRALGVYYFPGMWDWDRAMVEGLTRADLRRWLPDGSDDLATAERLIDAYVRWAPSADRFAPIRVASAYEAPVMDPRDPRDGLLDASGRAFHYIGEVDLLVTDEADRYWVVRHRIGSGGWAGEQVLVLDDRDVADCWGVEAAYLGIEVAGTISNELRLDMADYERFAGEEIGHHVSQNDPSGGGRSIPQHRRASVQGMAAPDAVRVEEHGRFRRTWIPRTPAQIAEAGIRVGQVVSDLVEPDLELYPSPSSRNCPSCDFLEPCVRMSRGLSADPLLQTAYRERGPRGVEPGRLGGATWGMGRGAVPPERWTTAKRSSGKE